MAKAAEWMLRRERANSFVLWDIEALPVEGIEEAIAGLTIRPA